MTAAREAEAVAGGAARRPRRAARLAATQALYQVLLTNAAAENVVAEFQKFRREGDGEGETNSLGGADLTLFADVVRGAAARREEIEAALQRVLAADWPLERLETLLRAVLWAGAYELLARPDVPLEVVINEYVEIAHAFFADKEPSFVNGVLDRLAREFRSMPEAAQRGGSAQSE
jgi:N utilization substance protein B